ncbi:MAG: ribosome-binding factor A [bacterium (Candidatus Ratteibacteria) CG_4_10_14_3_um_filter_41_18]|uniref:Ribosome-binding factor A n=4 Tax=Candidatus Ratteibacteria TaxID=2979319 RepID=A0A2M7E8T1_9BACT|nr:MAG: ribosome-binding factor A [Candidatus Omnitrophica bacterium CG1_02_41_171]PIV64108.1 MAG: ribosome-binding factor A [bacterium (Candidatus Ratteibacteria) CG01_land_8_20_14_3_00_40_19]PIW34234.1 MAG: ribosome-binding factor A [bacterium (Candidatus Ratteibacteria) CG15_BIG_FIL_POST_REV_8_21_14_020_41_12]PIW74405.1 MAG: ribosome-binding factor A [bacterium (Candidatus Ratteibacteria) CG_4_8_14_3_um_filter_41_36]PIX77606.1 MAG: ribosome-binding factor A [bacterium (Candidatus Ratteibacte
MAYQRAERVGKVIQHNLSEILQSELDDPRISLVSITRVEVSKDLSYARIFITGRSKDSSEKGLQSLINAKRIIRKRLAGVLRLRKVPEIIFKLDKELEEAQRIDELFEKIKTSK